MSSANLVSVVVIEEATYDTTPGTGNWDTVRLTSESLSATPSVNSSNEIRSDRMTADQFIVSTASEGSIDFELSAGGAFDMFLEGVMYNNWSTDVLTVGTTGISYSIEKEFTDLTANHFLVFSGMRVGGLSLNFSYGEPLTGSFTMAGASVTPASATQVVTGTTESTTAVMNAVSDLTTINVAGTAFGGCIQSISLNINNNLRPEQCIGSDTPGDQIAGTAEITGTIEAYLTDTTVQWYTSQVLNQSQFDIQFTVEDSAGNSYDFDLPNCRLSSSAPNATGINTDVMISADFTALYDSGSGSSLTITRVAV